MADDDDALNLDSRKYGGAYDGQRIGRELFRDALAALRRRGHQRPVRRLSVLVDSYFQNDYLEGVMSTSPGMDAVLAAPAMQRLEELRLVLIAEFCQTCEEYVLPASRVPCRFLRVLELSGCTLGQPPAAAAAFGLLEMLEMRSCISSSEDLQAMLDAAPSLARLWLEGITFKPVEPGLNWYDDAMPRRRVLLRCPGATVSVTVIHCHRTDGLDVDAPGARSLRYTGFLLHFPFGSPAAPPPANLQDAQLSFCTERWSGELVASRDVPPHALFWEPMGRFSRLRALKLELLDINDIAVHSEEEADVFLGAFPDLKFLELQGSYEVDAHGAAVAIANLLLCCPALQEFHLNLKLHGDLYAIPKPMLDLSDERKAQLGLEKFMESLKRPKSEKIVASQSSGVDDDDGCGDADLAALRARSFPCLESHLRKIKLEFELECFDCFEVRLAKFLVENALVLKEMEVHDGNQRVYDHIHHKLPIWRANSSKGKVKIVGKDHDGSST